MPLVSADRVKETTTTTGTGTLALAGAVSQFRAFSAICANADTVLYCIVGQTGTEWEVGTGTWTTGNNLARTTIHASSNAGSVVNLSAGTKDVFATWTATGPTLGLPRTKHLTSQHSISATAATEVTDLSITLEIGTFTFEYYIIEQSATITVAPLYGLNFTGTATTAKWWFSYADLSSTLLAAIGTVAHDTSTATLGFQMAKAEDDFATTTPNMGPSATTNAVQTTNTDLLVRISGLIKVTVAGDLELWHGSETATATSVEVGSSLIVVRTA